MFRPRKQDVEQLKQRDFLGKAKVQSVAVVNFKGVPTNSEGPTPRS